MWQRILEFLPSALIVWFVQFACQIYLQVGKMLWCGNTARMRQFQLFSFQDVSEAPDFNKAFFRLGLPFTLIASPCIEELLFRLPIILLHRNISSTAWISITISTMLFSLLHYHSRKTKHAKIMSAASSFIIGVAAGYLGIKYQSLWASIAFHAAWNLCIVILGELGYLGYRLQRFLPQRLLSLIRDASPGL